MTETEPLPAWKHTWRKAIGPYLSEPELEALKTALVGDDRRLIQGATTCPPPLQVYSEWPPDGACPLSLCGWLGDDLKTVREVEEFFAQFAYAIDERLGVPAGCRWFFNWVDDTPRQEMRMQLLTEVLRSLALHAGPLDAPVLPPRGELDNEPR